MVHTKEPVERAGIKRKGGLVMKTRLLVTGLFAVLMSVFSCTREKVDPDADMMVFYADATTTRTELQSDGAVFWSPKDEIAVYHNDYHGRFASTNTKAAASVEFRGILPSFVRDENQYFYAFYPCTEITVKEPVFGISLPAEQTAVEDTFADDLFISASRSKDNRLYFHNVCGGVKFSVAEDGIKKVVFKANGEEPLAGKLYFEFDSKGIPIVSRVGEGTSTVTLTVPDNGTFQKGKWYFLVLAPGTLSQGYTMEFYADKLVGKVSSSKSVQVKRSVWGVLSGLEPKDFVEIEAVDLGLSVKWANLNLGAKAVNDYGNYYSWGETEPNKSSFTWDNYKWGKPYNFTKYAQSQGKTVLDPEDDAAYQALKGKWRMATIEEFGELRNKCKWEETMIDGVVCYKVSGNGNYIIIPAYPGYYDGGITERGVNGYYWSSTILTSDWKWAQNLWFKDGISLQQGQRFFGEVIRAVYDDASRPVAHVSLVPEVDLKVGTSVTLSAVFDPETASNKRVSWASNKKNVAVVSPSGVVTAVSEGEADITVITEDGGKTATCHVTVLPVLSDCALPGIVDLGLTVKWATFNLGASAAEEPGHFYAWGETEVKDTYNLRTYKWQNADSYRYSFTKYNWESYYGRVDKRSFLDSDDDPVQKSLGGTWRMPSGEEIKELVTKCSKEVLKEGDVIMYKLTGPTGQSIYLPVTGFREDNSWRWRDEGWYWSSTLSSEMSTLGSGLTFDKYDFGITDMTRYMGLAIRPVRGSVKSVSLNKTDLDLSTGETVNLIASIDPVDATDKTIVWTSSNDAAAMVTASGELLAVGVGSAEITAKTKDGGKTATCNVTVKATSAIPTPAAIDLGLSVKWASFDVGASSPAVIGLYYAWGETEPKEEYTYASYNWDKYSSKDGKTMLEPEDDAASVHFGGKWRMPTREEIQELDEKCKWESVILNDTFVYKGTGPNGNFIFLKGSEYWAKDCRSRGDSEAGTLYLYGNSAVSLANRARYKGLLIRAVSD